MGARELDWRRPGPSRARGVVSALASPLWNEHTKRVLRGTGVWPATVPPGATSHYRMDSLEASGRYLVLDSYRGPDIPKEEWESLTYMTDGTNPKIFFAPITSATGKLELEPFWSYGKPDLEGVWTENASRCPIIVRWIESIGARFGRVQLLRMSPNSLRECRFRLHLDPNNRGNPESNGWIVRVWLELTDDPSSALVLRPSEFDRKNEAQINLPRYRQVVVDSDAVYHAAYHAGPHTRYGLLVRVESGAELERWIESQLPLGRAQEPSGRARNAVVDEVPELRSTESGSEPR